MAENVANRATTNGSLIYSGMNLAYGSGSTGVWSDETSSIATKRASSAPSFGLASSFSSSSKR